MSAANEAQSARDGRNDLPQIQPGGVILLYHRVVELESDPQLLAVRPEHFAQQMEVLRRIMRPMELGTMAESVRRKDDLTGAVCVTFDDGYADNVEAAAILADKGVPATVFVTPGLAAAGHEAFWDELERIFLQPGKLPQKLELAALKYAADLGSAADYSHKTFATHRAWNVVSDSDPTERQRIYRELCPLFHQATDVVREAALLELSAWAGSGEMRATHRMMTQEELRRLERCGVDVGAHTMTHPCLAVETLDEQRRQIRESKRALEAMVGQTVRAFSYPFGTRKDYSTQAVELVKEAGFDVACANFPGRVTAESDVWALPRFVVRDWDRAEFERRLGEWRRWVRR